jgi:TolB-like protein
MTRLYAIGAALIAIFTALASAAETPATQPAKPTVLVLSFAASADAGGSWIGRAAKDDIVAALRRDLDATVRTPSVARDAVDSAAALKLGQQYHADYVIYGYAQESGAVARITGQVLDVESGAAIGGLKVTGPAVRLLDIDDALTAQALQWLPQSIVKPDAIASLQQYMEPSEPAEDAPSADGLAMMSKSYPAGLATILLPVLDAPPVPAIQNVTYVYSPTIVLSDSYGYGDPFAPAYYNPYFGYPGWFVSAPIGHSRHHGPVIHHGPARPGFAGSPATGDGIVIADGFGASNSSTPVSFSWGQNAGPVSTPFMGGGQSFPPQNGFVTIGASAGFSVFTGPRFNTPNFPRGYVGRSGR